MDSSTNPPIYTPPAPQPSVVPGPMAGQQPIPGQLVAQQYVITMNGSPVKATSRNYRALTITANIQLGCTGLCVLLGIFAILVRCKISEAGVPIWISLMFFMVPGILGNVAVCKKSNCSIVAYMVLSIIGAAVAGGFMILMLIVTIEEATYHFYYDYPNPVIDSSRTGRVVINALLCITGLVEMVTAIVASAYCCKGTCCMPASPMQILYTQATPAGTAVLPQGGQQGTVMIPQGQMMMMNPNPQLPPYEAQAAPLPDKSTMGMQPVPVTTYMPPSHQSPMAQQATAPPAVAGSQVSDGTPSTHSDNGTDHQPLVMY